MCLTSTGLLKTNRFQALYGVNLRTKFESVIFHFFFARYRSDR